MFRLKYPYDMDRLYELDPVPTEIAVPDHLNGFNISWYNEVLHKLDTFAYEKDIKLQIYTSYFFTPALTNTYPNLIFGCDEFYGLAQFKNYTVHPEHNFVNCLCSFNGAPQVGRKLLVAALNKFDLFDPAYSSKNFAFDSETISGHIQDYMAEQENFYYKFFIDGNSDNFFQTVTSFDHSQYEHEKNIKILESKLSQSFVHLVSETLATSQYPFITEKFLYSVVTRGLFVAYAQPNWHKHLDQIYGFKSYNKIFDYRFDVIENPILRLIELITMLLKFKFLSTHEWHDLWLIEKDTIEYNYDHYFSGDYLKHLANATHGQQWFHRES